jgi:uncharacterized protein
MPKTNQVNRDPLARAAAAGDLSQVKALLDAGHSVNAKAGDGNTALSLAAYEGHLDVLKQLLKSNADVNAQNM